MCRTQIGNKYKHKKRTEVMDLFLNLYFSANDLSLQLRLSASEILKALSKFVPSEESEKFCSFLWRLLTMTVTFIKNNKRFYF